MKQTKQQLYERIMKKVAPIVKQAINEKFNSVNEHAVRHGRKSLLYRSRLNESKALTPEEFYEKTDEAYDEWCRIGDSVTKEIAADLEKKGKISPDMDEYDVFDEIYDVAMERFGELLDKAVGGDWNEVGKQVGLDDYDLECLYADSMQGKCDCVGEFAYDYVNSDDED